MSLVDAAPPGHQHKPSLILEWSNHPCSHQKSGTYVINNKEPTTVVKVGITGKKNEYNVSMSLNKNLHFVVHFKNSMFILHMVFH